MARPYAFFLLHKHNLVKFECIRSFFLLQHLLPKAEHVTQHYTIVLENWKEVKSGRDELKIKPFLCQVQFVLTISLPFYFF